MFNKHHIKPKARIQSEEEARQEPLHGLSYGELFYIRNYAHELEKIIQHDFEKDEMGKQFIVLTASGKIAYYYLHHSPTQITIFQEKKVEQLSDKKVVYPRGTPLKSIEALGETYQLDAALNGYLFHDIRDRAKTIKQLIYLSPSEQSQIRILFEEKKVSFFVGKRFFLEDFTLTKEDDFGEDDTPLYDEKDLV